MPSDQLFYVGQKALIEKAGKVLILNDPIFGLDLPGGKIQVGELDFEKALRREVREETGLKIEIDIPFFRGYFEFPSESQHRSRGKKIFIIYYKTRYVSGEVRLSEEHDDFQWVDKNSYKKLKASKRTQVNIEALNEYFKIYEK